MVTMIICIKIIIKNNTFRVMNSMHEDDLKNVRKLFTGKIYQQKINIPYLQCTEELITIVSLKQNFKSYIQKHFQNSIPKVMMIHNYIKTFILNQNMLPK